MEFVCILCEHCVNAHSVMWRLYKGCVKYGSCLKVVWRLSEDCVKVV